jgi:hypothetical protein
MCGISQREYITAQTIDESMHLLEPVNTEFCVGEYPFLVRHCVKNPSPDVLIVWEHFEIPNIIRQFNIPISDWPNTINDHYDIVFMIDVGQSKLFYDCYDVGFHSIDPSIRSLSSGSSSGSSSTSRTNCSETVKEWLYGYENIVRLEKPHHPFEYIERFDYSFFVLLALVCLLSSICPSTRTEFIDSNRASGELLYYVDVEIVSPNYQSIEQR